MKRIFLILSLLFVSSFVFASDHEFAEYKREAKRCSDLKCVREHMDRVDHEIVKLVAKRLAFVQRAGELKPGDVGIASEISENKVLAGATHQAQVMGSSPQVMSMLMKTLSKCAKKFEDRFGSS